MSHVSFHRSSCLGRADGMPDTKQLAYPGLLIPSTGACSQESVACENFRRKIPRLAGIARMVCNFSTVREGR